LAAALDAEERAAAHRQAQAWLELSSKMTAAEDLTDQFWATAEMLARGALMTAGYQQHHRGEWRRRS
jgi:hypothetical protein